MSFLEGIRLTISTRLQTGIEKSRKLCVME